MDANGDRWQLAPIEVPDPDAAEEADTADAEGQAAADQRLGPSAADESGRDATAFASKPSRVDTASEDEIVGVVVPDLRRADMGRVLCAAASEPSHVHVLFLGASAEASDTGGDDAPEATGSEGTDGSEPEDGSLEASHDEHGTTYGAYRAAPDGTLTFEPIDVSGSNSQEDYATGSSSKPEDQAEADPAGEHEVAEGAEEADSVHKDEDAENPLARALGTTVRTVGGVLADVSGQALEAWRRGPGERIVEAKLDKQARRYGIAALNREVREARRSAPLGMKRDAARRTRFYGGSIYVEAMKEFKEATYAQWELERMAGEPSGDEAEGKDE